MARSKGKYTSEQLIDYCLEETTIECTNCKEAGSSQTDAHYASVDFFNQGWRGTSVNVYCPKCAKKKLKS